MGLKYLSSMTFHSGSAVCRSVRISSIIHFVQPYGFEAGSFCMVSTNGTSLSPYTVAELEKMMVLQPCARIASHSTSVPLMLFS